MDRKGLVAIFIIIAIVIVAALLIWGFVSLGGDDSSGGDGGGLTIVDDGVDAETGALLQESFVDNNDDLGLGEVI